MGSVRKPSWPRAVQQAADYYFFITSMIPYVKGFLGIPSLTYLQGSVLPRCTVPATVSALICIGIRWLGWVSGDLPLPDEAPHDPEEFSNYGVLLCFSCMNHLFFTCCNTCTRRHFSSRYDSIYSENRSTKSHRTGGIVDRFGSVSIVKFCRRFHGHLSRPAGVCKILAGANGSV